MMHKMSINDLPKYTPWVARLLGLEPFSKIVRNLAKVDVEYERGKYADLLEYCRQRPNATFREIWVRVAYGERNPICVSKGGELFLCSPGESHQMRCETLIDAVAEYIGRTQVVVELGCGYGDNLATLRDAYQGRLFIGGECSQNAIKLGNLLFADCDDTSVVPFNWYDDTWEIFETLESKALVFTVSSIEQLPSVSSILPTFKKYRDKISAVVHMEPVYELLGNQSVLDLMRRAYTRLVDYNTDLMATLETMKVQIVKTEKDVMGVNPLLPYSLVCWRF